MEKKRIFFKWYLRHRRHEWDRIDKRLVVLEVGQKARAAYNKPCTHCSPLALKEKSKGFKTYHP